MKDESPGFHRWFSFILPPSSFILPLRRRSQVVRQRSAKPLFIGSIPIAASIYNQQLTVNRKLLRAPLVCVYGASRILFTVERVF